MSGDVLSLAAEMTPYVSAAAAAYGGAVLAKARDEAADATVGLGRRLLQRVFGVRREGEPLPGPLAELAASPGDEDALAAVRLAIRTALAAEPEMETELRSMLTTHVHANRDGFSSARDQIITINNNYAGSTVRPQKPGFPSQRTWGHVPTRNPAFQGREDQLAAVREALLSGDRAVVQALHGMGGVGKTQLAIEYAHRFAADYDLVWWIAAEQPELVGAQFAAMAAALEWPPAGTLMELRQMIRSRLQGQSRWLLVFDNAENPRDVADWLPGGGGHVLITSRSHRWTEIAVPVEIDVLTKAESVALLQQRVPFFDQGDAYSVADALGDLPLALAQAAEYMADTGMPAGQYLELLTAHAAEILDQGQLMIYPQSLAAVIRVALGRLKEDDPAAAEFALMCAFLAPEPVPVQWLAAADLAGAAGQQAADPFRWRPAVARIRQAALTLTRVGQDALQMHRLTQAVLRGMISPVEAAAIRSRAVALLAACHPGSPQDARSWPGWARMIPHVLALDPVTTPSPDLRNLACDAAWYLGKRGDAQASHDLARRLYSHWRDQLGPDDHDTLQAAYNLAFALSLLGKDQEARDLDEDTLARRRRLLGEDHVKTLQSTIAFASRVGSVGDIQAARNLEEDVLGRCRRVLGEDHPLTLGAADNFARSLWQLGGPGAARELAEDTLARRRRVLGEDHPDTLLSAGRLAGILGELGEHHAARELNEDTLPRYRRVYGDDHPDALGYAYGLAWTLSELGEHEAARELGEDTLARYQQTLGADDPDTLNSASNLAGFLCGLGNYQAARELEEDTLARRRRVLGEDHPDTLLSAGKLAGILGELGEHHAARELDEDTLPRQRRVYGDDHPDTLVSADGLAWTLSELGEPGAARELEDDTLARRRRVLGEDHPDTLLSAGRLAHFLRELGEHHAARDLEQDTLPRYRRVYGDDHPDTLGYAYGLAWTLSELGEHEAARELGEDTLARYQQTLGADHPDTLNSASDLAGFVRALGNYQAARELDEDTLARRRRVLGDDHPDTLLSADSLAEDLRALGQP